jgi:hypothetical protein
MRRYCGLAEYGKRRIAEATGKRDPEIRDYAVIRSSGLPIAPNAISHVGTLKTKYWDSVVVVESSINTRIAFGLSELDRLLIITELHPIDLSWLSNSEQFPFSATYQAENVNHIANKSSPPSGISRGRTNSVTH